MLFEIYLEEKSWRFHFLTGLMVAVTFLTKASNIAILPLAAGVIFIKAKQAVSQKRFKYYIPALTVFTLACVIPIAFWLGRNYVLFGDVIGSYSSEKVRTWTRKPFGKMFNHPIFTPSGLFYFLTELTKRLWRGEFVWKLKEISSPAMDLFYCISSALFFIISLFGLVFNRSKIDGPYRFALWSGLFVVVFSVLFLAVSSMRYDFGQCFYPSREKPYFISSRLIAGVILPFLFLYIYGLQRLLSWLCCASRLLVIIAVLVAVITISEIVLTWPVFGSSFNWFNFR
jgi:hypothetical protein